MICYVICSGPRAGSHYLASLLSSTGVAGAPADHFNPLGAGTRPDLLRDGTTRYDRHYVDRLVTDTATPNHVFGTMVQFNQVANYVGLTRFRSLFPSEPQFIFLRRKDETRQAVSLALARQTGQFLATEPAQRAPVYNADQIRCCLEDVRNHNRGWDTWFWEHRIAAHSVDYEHCVADPVAVVDVILTFLGGVRLTPAAAIPTSSLRRQSNELNDRWTQRYLQEPLP
jgi:LPS sulfotransferase NodH